MGELYAAVPALGTAWVHTLAQQCAQAGLPFPGNWQVDVVSTFGSGIDTLRFFDGDGNEIPLDLSVTASIIARNVPAACRPDCTLPRCHWRSGRILTPW